MKKPVILLGLMLIFSCSEKKTETTNTSDATSELADKQREIDSLKAVIAENQHNATDTFGIPMDPEPQVAPPENTGNTLKDLSGKHPLTLQWISWDRPGSITFKKTGTNRYNVSGNQKNGSDYLKVEGVITQISNEELHFEGTVETLIATNGGKCLRTGPQIFLVTKNRKYWRMQNMVECFGLTDYVDIYF